MRVDLPVPEGPLNKILSPLFISKLIEENIS